MKKIILGPIFLLIVLVLSGCGSQPVVVNEDGQNLSPSNVYLSSDGGESWLPQHSDSVNLANKNILNLVVNPQDEKQAFLGTSKNGILKTDDQGATWKSLESFKAEKVYGIDLDQNNPAIIYASGVWQERGKIYKSYDGGVKWEEIYTEAAEGPLVTSLLVNRRNPNIVYATNSDNIFLKSVDGGKNWKKTFKTNSAVIQIINTPLSPEKIFLLTTGNDFYRSTDGGSNFSEISKKISTASDDFSSNIYTGTFDSRGVLYLGGDMGIVRSSNNGESWEKVETLSDSSNFPVRALDVNPQNDQEIIYAAARAVYRSSDRGVTWSSFQLDSENIARVLKYGSLNPQIVYLGLFEK